MSRRTAVAALSLAGLAVALYLTLYQAKVVSTVWDPFGLGGSEWILRRSPLVRWLGFPDAAFGIAAYGAELALDLVAGHRPGATPTLVLGGIALAMAAGGLLLVVLQGVFGHWCSLCLVSAALSWAVLALVAPDARAARAERRPDMAGAVRG